LRGLVGLDERAADDMLADRRAGDRYAAYIAAANTCHDLRARTQADCSVTSCGEIIGCEIAQVIYLNNRRLSIYRDRAVLVHDDSDVIRSKS